MGRHETSLEQLSFMRAMVARPVLARLHARNAPRRRQSLSFYEILGPLGVGAMGEVYRAKDTKLDREVAIKVLPEHLAEDEERLRRFEREAKSLVGSVP